MLVPAHVFREYDIRGVADKELSDELIGAIGQEFAHALYEDAPGAERLEIAVGRDCRLSSPRMLEALTEGLLRGGVDVIDIGVGPTPLLYFPVHHLNTDGGVLITGSTNPADNTGLTSLHGMPSSFAAHIP